MHLVHSEVILCVMRRRMAMNDDSGSCRDCLRGGTIPS
jgi:hypothetical protein